MFIMTSHEKFVSFKTGYKLSPHGDTINKLTEMK